MSFAEKARGAAERMLAQRAAHREGDALWAAAESVADLCELTAKWCEGKITYHPNGHSEGPDPETHLMAGELAALNRAGLLTFCSQAAETYDHGSWGAFVTALTDEATANRIRAAAPPHVRVSVYAPSESWRQRLWPGVGPRPEGDPDQVWERMSASQRATEFGGLDDGLWEQVAQMWQITIEDTRPGVNDMWGGWLMAAAENRPDLPELAVCPESGMASRRMDDGRWHVLDVTGGEGDASPPPGAVRYTPTPAPTASPAPPPGGTAMSVAEVKAQIAQVIEELPAGILMNAANEVGRLTGYVSQAVEGSNDAEAQEAVRILYHCSQEMGQLAGTLWAARDKLTGYIGRA